jgi:protein arginine kinase
MDKFLPTSVSAWLRHEGPESDVVLSSRVRLARNFAGFQFVNRCSTADRQAVLTAAQKCIMQAELAPHMVWVPLNSAPPIQRRVLVERRLISAQLASGDEPRAVAVSTPEEEFAVMVNEEDHLRMQSIRPGFDLKRAFDDLDAADDRLEKLADFAYHPRFGYLTACPTNVGTGIRISVMLHLPALKMTGELDKVQRAAKAMSLAVRGSFGEGSDASGDIFQISNQTTLGKPEREFLEDFRSKIIPKVIAYERDARQQLVSKRHIFLEDQVHRALGVLRSARLLKTEEAMQLISHVRLGVAAGLIDMPITTLNELTLLVQPAHLQRHVGRALEQADRRVERATLCRERLPVID